MVRLWPGAACWTEDDGILECADRRPRMLRPTEAFHMIYAERSARLPFRRQPERLEEEPPPPRNNLPRKKHGVQSKSRPGKRSNGSARLEAKRPALLLQFKGNPPRFAYSYADPPTRRDVSSPTTRCSKVPSTDQSLGTSKRPH